VAKGKKGQISIKLTTLVGIALLIAALVIVGKVGYNYIMESRDGDSKKVAGSTADGENSDDDKNTGTKNPDLFVNTKIGLKIFIEDGKPCLEANEGIFEFSFNVEDETAPIAKKVKAVPLSEDLNEELWFITEDGELWTTNTSRILDEGIIQLEYFYPYYEYKIEDIIIRGELPYEEYEVDYPVISIRIVLKDGTEILTDTYEMYSQLED